MGETVEQLKEDNAALQTLLKQKHHDLLRAQRMALESSIVANQMQLRDVMQELDALEKKNA